MSRLKDVVVRCGKCNQEMLILEVSPDEREITVAPCYTCQKEAYGDGLEYALDMEVL